MTCFKVGGIVHWPIDVARSRSPFETPRGKIHDLSKRSRLRCAWLLANAPKPWGAMAVLTFRTQPSHPKEALKFFVRRFRLDHGNHWQWSWIMEWQSRGVIHFHLFFENAFLDSLGYHTERLVRHGKETEIIRGNVEDWIVETWCRAVGDATIAFRRFQMGGIVELLRTPDAAARYVAREAGKRTQKQLPEGVEAAGRWWFISRAGKPKPGKTIVIKNYPWPTAYRFIFDRKSLERPFKETKILGTLRTKPLRISSSR